MIDDSAHLDVPPFDRAAPPFPSSRGAPGGGVSDRSGVSGETRSELLARSEALGVLVDEWEELVRNGGRERSPGQLDGVMRDLGPMPEADAPSARALWIAGLINPLPALGVALEVRPAALMAPTAEVRLQVVEMGLQDSIERLKSDGPAF